MQKNRLSSFFCTVIICFLMQSCFAAPINTKNSPAPVARSLLNSIQSMQNPYAVALVRAEGIRTNCVAATSGFCQVTLSDAHENSLILVAGKNGFDLYTINTNKLLGDLKSNHQNVKGFILAEELSSNIYVGDRSVAKPIIFNLNHLMFKNNVLQFDGNMNQGVLANVSDEDVILTIPLADLSKVIPESKFAGTALPKYFVHSNY